MSVAPNNRPPVSIRKMSDEAKTLIEATDFADTLLPVLEAESRHKRPVQLRRLIELAQHLIEAKVARLGAAEDAQNATV